jgi:hypothetical protein
MGEDLLRRFIYESIAPKDVSLSNGKIAEYGSSPHIEELDRMVTELDGLRRQMKSKNLRKERYTISRAIDSIRLIKRRAKKAGIRSGLLKEDD